MHKPGAPHPQGEPGSARGAAQERNSECKGPEAGLCLDRPRKAREAPNPEPYLEMQTVSKNNSEVGGLTPSRWQVLAQTQQMGRVAETLDRS